MNNNYIVCVRPEALSPTMIASAKRLGMTLCEDVLVNMEVPRRPLEDRVHKMSRAVKMGMEDEFFKKWKPS